MSLRKNGSLRRARSSGFLPAAAASILVLSACAPGGQPGPDSSARPISTELGDEPITLTMYSETGFPLFDELAHEFERQYPNVTFDIRNDEASVLEQNAPRLLSGDDAPDFIRLDLKPDLVRDGLVLDLQPYAEAYGWEDLPASMLSSNRVDASGTALGSGGLYGFGPTSNLTGVFYNKSHAASIGMNEPPATLDEFEDLLPKAKAAGLVPIVQGNSTGTATITYQSLLNQFVEPSLINDWIFNLPDMSIEVPGAVEAAEVLQRWARSGYVSADANAVDYTTMVGRFVAGEAVFMFLGNWQAADLANQMGDNVGFFPLPPRSAGDPFIAMAQFGGAVIPARAAHPDAAAFFMNWTVTNETARQIAIDVTGMVPPPLPGAPAPDVTSGSVIADALASFDQVASDNGIVGFLDTATSGLLQNAVAPGLQELIDDQVTPEDFVAQLQATYEEDLGR